MVGKARFRHEDRFFVHQAGRRLCERNFCVAKIIKV